MPLESKKETSLIPLKRYRPSNNLLDQAINAKWYHIRRIRSPNEYVYLYLEHGHDYNKSLPSELIKMAGRHANYTTKMRLRDAADFAKISNMILVHSSVMQWQRRRTAYELNRVHKIGNYSYIFLKPEEITETECIKHLKYIKELY